VLKLLAERQVADAVQVMRILMAEVRAADFDIEAACNTLMVLARVIGTEVQIDSDATVRALAQRFAVSRATCDLLCRSTHPNADIETAIREAYASTCREAEQAISHTVGGAPREAVLALLAQGERSLNAKLLDLAWLTLERHRAAIADADELMQQAAALRVRYCNAGAQVRLAPAPQQQPPSPTA
jgi:hypothetical protein